MKLPACASSPPPEEKLDSPADVAGIDTFLLREELSPLLIRDRSDVLRVSYFLPTRLVLALCAALPVLMLLGLLYLDGPPAGSWAIGGGMTALSCVVAAAFVVWLDRLLEPLRARRVRLVYDKTSQILTLPDGRGEVAKGNLVAIVVLSGRSERADTAGKCSELSVVCRRGDELWRTAIVLTSDHYAGRIARRLSACTGVEVATVEKQDCSVAGQDGGR